VAIAVGGGVVAGFFAPTREPIVVAWVLATSIREATDHEVQRARITPRLRRSTESCTSFAAGCRNPSFAL
jgi:hypothetical protein